MAPTSPQKAFIAPFAVFIAALIVADFFPASARYWIYPVQTIICGALVIRFWTFYRLGIPKMAGFILFVAVLVLFLWISPQLIGKSGRFDGFDPSVFKDRPALYISVVAFRFLRLVVVVPFIEEIFWRGFLLRYFLHYMPRGAPYKDDFESVPFGTFTWHSFTLVTIGFCLEHQPIDMPAALITGALYNLIAYRTRSLSSCILAHSITNLLLGIYIMRTGQWGFW